MSECPKCNDTGYYRLGDSDIHCWECRCIAKRSEMDELAALRKRVEELEGAKAEQEKNTLRYVVKEDPSGEVGMVWVAMDQESIDYQLNEDTKRISFDAEDFVGAQMTVIFSDGREASASV